MIAKKNLSVKEPLFFNAFNQISEIGSVRFRKLLNHFPSLEIAWTAPVQEFFKARLEEQVVAKIAETRNKIDPQEEFTKLQNLGIRILIFSDESYPKLLREIPNPPMILYLLGELKTQDEMAIAIVGSRKFTSYGKQVTQDLVRELANTGATIVSGLALGIDAIAHETALNFRGRTIAVLACGLNAVYPLHNQKLADKILESQGALISEFPLGTPPLKHHFPNRNRIISGLCLGTVVIEAAMDSGALITATHALEQNRQVFAVPGSIYSPCSAGTNNLIKMGAKPVTKAADILEDLNLGHLQVAIETQEIIGENEQEEKILKILSREPQHFDIICKSAGLASSVIAAALTIMEMKGKVKNIGGNQYVLGR